jgi:tRNA pseudouridine32 synthase/23S rRNA pseudouridine746 synthase
MSTAPQLLHVDAGLAVALKPAGLLAVPGRGEDGHLNLTAWVQQQLPDALVVHRLDMATSGLMLFARGTAMQRALSALFEARAVAKDYRAWVHGAVDGEAGRIDLPLAADWPRRPRQQVDPVHGKPASTLWQVLARQPGPARTLLLLQPITGRSHQLRVHLLAQGHAIVGDTLYAPELEPAPRLMLHAERLAFDHPVSGERCHFHSPAPF